jgi:acyl-CoA synthetase (NDP forming)
MPVIMVLNEELNDDDHIEFEVDRRLLRTYYLAHGLPVYPTVERAAKALANVLKYKDKFLKKTGQEGRS